MKWLYIFTLVLLVSCTPQNSYIAECIDMLDKSLPDTYTFENDYTIKIAVDNEGQAEMRVFADNQHIVQSCYITFMFSDFIKSKKYYKQLYTFLKNGNWQFIENINKYKRQSGEVYTKNGVYLGIYEQVYFSIPVALSKNKENFYKEGFCD